MPRGFAGILEARKEIDAKSQGDGPGFRYFKLKDNGDEAVVRFLEQGDEVNWAWCHQVVTPTSPNEYGTLIPCQSQKMVNPNECILCERGDGRSFKGWINLIWRGGGEDGEDILALWNAGIGVFETLSLKDKRYKGLSSRDFVITRKGAARSKKTSYDVDPADDGPSELSENDKLIANNKVDLTRFTKVKSDDEIRAILTGQPNDDDDEDSPVADGPFANRRKSRSVANSE